MAQHLTCPHCETALAIDDHVDARKVRCPNCQALIPYRGLRGIVLGIDVEAQGTAGNGKRTASFIALFCLGICFACGVFAGTLHDGVLLLAMVTAGPGLALLGMCWATAGLVEAGTYQLNADKPPSWGRDLLLVVNVVFAVVAGIVVGAFALVMAALAFLGGMALSNL